MLTLALYSLVAYAALTLLFYMLSFVFGPFAFVARCLAAYACLIASSAFGLVSAPILHLAGYAGLSQWLVARFFVAVMGFATGIWFDVRDPDRVLPSTRPAVFIGNHQTELDVLMLGAVFPRYCSVTAKASLRRWPLFGWWMAASGSIFIDRKNSHDARDAMRGAAHEITSRRQSVYMFPEGTRSYAKDPVLLPFKKGAFHLAVEAGVPIVPVVVANYSHVLWIRGLVFNAGRIPVQVLSPIPTVGLTSADVEDLVKRTHDAMLDVLIPLSAEAKGKKVEPPQPIPVDESSSQSTGVETVSAL